MMEFYSIGEYYKNRLRMKTIEAVSNLEDVLAVLRDKFIDCEEFWDFEEWIKHYLVGHNDITYKILKFVPGAFGEKVEVEELLEVLAEEED